MGLGDDDAGRGLLDVDGRDIIEGVFTGWGEEYRRS
jgi:hypothetical protein